MIPLEQLGLAIKRMQDRHHKAIDTKLAPIGGSVVQWHALREIDRNPGSTQLRLAELTFNSAQAFGALMTRMLRDDLVRRESGIGRAYSLSLTPKGQQLLHDGEDAIQTVLEQSFAGLNEQERVQLQGLLDKALAGSISA